jgi:spermidine synthase
VPPPKASLPHARWDPLLFASTIFASAFLIFLVQPMVAKRILPWFGGAPAVWSLCLAFYQTALFAGYAYAHLLIRWLRPALQPPVHGLVLATALLALPVLPGDARAPTGGSDPSGTILAILARHVALPFLALAATGPLVQSWFSRRHAGRSPYPLYAVSNAGSLLALLSYPFLIEPRLPLSVTGSLWSAAFVLTGIGVVACAGLAARASAQLPDPGAAAASSSPPAGVARIALWVLLSACAVMLLCGVTNELCLDAAAVPFLWILPLSVYLVSFILRFRSERSRRRVPYLVLAAGLLFLPAIEGFLGGDGRLTAMAATVQGQIVLWCLVLFAACMLLHGELHRLRPGAPRLTLYYLCISGGGALGGIYVGLFAPRLFDDYLEVPLGLSLGCLLLVASRWYDSQGWLHGGAPRWRWATAMTATLAAGWGFWSGAFAQDEETVLLKRTFFGLLRVQQLGSGEGLQRQLLHGTTLHGVQLSLREQSPSLYFGELTGIGLALTQREAGRPSTVGVVGLGIGTLAAYARPGDRFRFYEIDPGVIGIARNPDYFTYLANSRAELEIVEGDARISLASELGKEGGGRFDFLIIDAFNSDAIPVHLVTREAFDLYRKSLREGGVLAVHVSNRHFDLSPLIARLGEGIGFSNTSIETTDQLTPYLSAESFWMFLSSDAGRLSSLRRLALLRRSQLRLPHDAIRVHVFSSAETTDVRPWTDDYSDLFGALRPISLGDEDGTGAR